MSETILIVDDSLTVRMDLAEAFEAAGFRTVTRSTIAEARAALGEEPVGLVVLDVLLPDGDGVDFLREIRSGAVQPRVIMLSGEAEVKDRIRGLKTGADEYVGKPYDTKYVIARARGLLRGGDGTRTPDRPTVFVIDDSPTFRSTLAEALQQAGYTVATAATGEAALALLTDLRPNAVIVDGVMPGMDGATLIRRLRLDAAFRAIPCLLLTASDDGGAQLRALDAGADAFVRKDEDMDIILARVAAVIRQSVNTRTEQVTSLVGPRKILAVDDSDTYLHELAGALGDEGYDVSLARSGEEALELLAVQPVDCILMDLMMPGMGGKEACQRIKTAPGVRDIPLILLTAIDDRTAMLDGLTAGADDYISKSSEFEVVKARVRAQIRRKQFEDENRNIRDELLRREVEAAEARAARELAESRAKLVEELERKVEERTRELKVQIVERQQAERMASVGMLAASVAHEINNPLAVVSGNLDILAEVASAIAREAALSREPGVAEHAAQLDQPIRDSREAADRVRQIVRDLRMFSRSDDAEEPRPVDIARVLESSIRMASNEIRHRARLERAFGSMPPVLGNESRLGQVFLNLIVNAAQAIPEGHAEENLIRVATSIDARGRVAVAVTDSGVGIPPDKLQRVFEPFFTTKPAGIGTGLGLPICQRIVTEYGGEISVTSEVGKGTTFTVALQATAPAEAPREAPRAAQAAAVPARPRKRILVVDDEPALGKLITQILSRTDDVTTVTSARDALDRFQKGERYDAVLSDLMMPEMSGIELQKNLLALDPAQAARMVFMTGGAFTEDAIAFLKDAANPVVEKPFKSADLKKTVEAVLAKAA